MQGSFWRTVSCFRSFAWLSGHCCIIYSIRASWKGTGRQLISRMSMQGWLRDRRNVKEEGLKWAVNTKQVMKKRKKFNESKRNSNSGTRRLRRNRLRTMESTITKRMSMDHKKTTLSHRSDTKTLRTLINLRTSTRTTQIPPLQTQIWQPCPSKISELPLIRDPEHNKCTYNAWKPTLVRGKTCTRHVNPLKILQVNHSS